MPAALAIVEVEASEPEAPPQPYIEPDPTWRVLHSTPPPNYPAKGMIPPWAERIY